jgi:hypothetical protein
VETECRMIEAKAFKTLIIIYSLLKSELLSANIKLSLHKALIRLDACLGTSGRHLPYKIPASPIPRTIGNFARCGSVRDLHTAFVLSLACDSDLCRQERGRLKILAA